MSRAIQVKKKTRNKKEVTNENDIAGKINLSIKRVIRATPERVFRAWTNPEELQKWWGPTGVRCLSAEVDLQIGGQYRIANELPDGKTLWITGKFEKIKSPHLLIYTWTVESKSPNTELVCVQFEKHEHGTEIILKHELISTTELRDQHEQGWYGCLDGLVTYLAD